MMHQADTTLEEELQVAHEEITKIEKSLKNLLTVTEFLFESQEDLQSRLDFETAQVEDSKRQAITSSLKLEQVLVRKNT